MEPIQLGSGGTDPADQGWLLSGATLGLIGKELPVQPAGLQRRGEMSAHLKKYDICKKNTFAMFPKMCC